MGSAPGSHKRSAAPPLRPSGTGVGCLTTRRAAERTGRGVGGVHCTARVAQAFWLLRRQPHLLHPTKALKTQKNIVRDTFLKSLLIQRFALRHKITIAWVERERIIISVLLIIQKSMQWLSGVVRGWWGTPTAGTNARVTWKAHFPWERHALPFHSSLKWPSSPIALLKDLQQTEKFG